VLHEEIAAVTITKHVILGAGGAIGNVLANELIAQGEKVKLVSRRGQGGPGLEAVSGDLTDARQVAEAIEQSSTVYLLAGLQYKTQVWQVQWPTIMKNVVAACVARNARLIFFDNVYLYGKVDGPMTEDTPTNPCSRKGEVRAHIIDYLMAEIKQGTISAMVARSGDFYGPFADKSSVPFQLVIERLAKGGSARWLSSADRKHSFTYTVDCGKALYRLAITDDAYGQVWHLPTAGPALTGKQFTELVALKLGVRPNIQILRKWMLRVGGLFDSLVRELPEMLYQNEYDYIFDSSKFENYFHVTPTSYEKGIADTIDFYRRRNLI
jgi:nucleoside-diphosphate-sugar epimerase